MSYSVCMLASIVSDADQHGGVLKPWIHVPMYYLYENVANNIVIDWTNVSILNVLKQKLTQIYVLLLER